MLLHMVMYAPTRAAVAIAQVVAMNLTSLAIVRVGFHYPDAKGGVVGDVSLTASAWPLPARSPSTPRCRC